MAAGATAPVVAPAQGESCVYATDIERVANALPAAFAAATQVELTEVQRYLYRGHYQRDGVKLALTVRLSRVQGGTLVEVSCAAPTSPRQTALALAAVITVIPLLFWGLYALAKVLIAPAKVSAADRQLELVHGIFTHLTDHLEAAPTQGYRGGRQRFVVEPSAPARRERSSAPPGRVRLGADADTDAEDVAADAERAAARNTSRG
jgi:hypothetical protein